MPWKREFQLLNELFRNYFDRIYLTIRNQSEILELLIKEGSARLDFTNKKQLTALHLSVNKSFPECARVLVKNHCDVNKQVGFIN